MIATVTLNPSIDQYTVVARLRKDDVSRSLEEYTLAGGKGINVSRVLVGLGVQTKAFALIGGHLGSVFFRLVRRSRIPLETVKVSGNTRRNIVITDLSDRSQSRVCAAGPEVSLSNVRSLEKKILSHAKRIFACILSGSLPRGLPPHVYRDMISRFQRHQIPCVLDADDHTFRIGIQAKPFCIKPNEYEMRRLSRKRLRTDNDFVHAACLLVESGISYVVVSLEKRGALFVSKVCDPFFVRAPRVRVRSKVGAGDALIAGFMMGLKKNWGLQMAARFSVAVSSRAVMLNGGGLVRNSDIKNLLNRVQISRTFKS